MNIFSKIKKLFTFEPRNFDWVCEDCNQRIDGNRYDEFIKHQISAKHYNCHKEPKYD